MTLRLPMGGWEGRSLDIPSYDTAETIVTAVSDAAPSGFIPGAGCWYISPSVAVEVKIGTNAAEHVAGILLPAGSFFPLSTLAADEVIIVASAVGEVRMYKMRGQ